MMSSATPFRKGFLSFFLSFYTNDTEAQTESDLRDPPIILYFLLP